jgi:hypothetical protein
MSIIEKILLGIGGAIMIMVVIAVTHSLLNFYSCINNKNTTWNECFNGLAESNPTFNEGKEIGEQCINGSGINCVKTIATNAVSDKAQDDFSKTVS